MCVVLSTCHVARVGNIFRNIFFLVIGFKKIFLIEGTVNFAHLTAHVTVHCANMNVAVCGDEHGHVCAMKA